MRYRGPAALTAASGPGREGRVAELLNDADRRRSVASRGQDLVRERFLLTRLVADALRLYTSILGSSPAPTTTTTAAIADEPRDPVCGVRVDPSTARELVLGDVTHHFCSRACEDEFAADPDRFLRAVARPSGTRHRFSHLGRGARRARDFGP
jgi:trehalose synthase